MTSTATIAEPRSVDRGEAAPAIVVTDVVKTFGQGATQITALDGLNLSVAQGEFVCLLGASGCGKSTLLNLIAKLDTKTSGTIEVNTKRPAVMFQEAALLPWLTTARNVDLPLRLDGIGSTERKRRVSELLELVHLSGMDDKRPHELSGGMRQRVALARSLATTTGGVATDEPGLLLMDEPFGALDAITRDVLQGELLRIWEATRTAILFVTHDVREAVRLSQRVVLLSSRPGRVVGEWQTKDADHESLTDEITGKLRDVISTHAQT